MPLVSQSQSHRGMGIVLLVLTLSRHLISLLRSRSLAPSCSLAQSFDRIHKIVMEPRMMKLTQKSILESALSISSTPLRSFEVERYGSNHMESIDFVMNIYPILNLLLNKFGIYQGTRERNMAPSRAPMEVWRIWIELAMKRVPKYFYTRSLKSLPQLSVMCGGERLFSCFFTSTTIYLLCTCTSCSLLYLALFLQAPKLPLLATLDSCLPMNSIRYFQYVFHC